MEPVQLRCHPATPCTSVRGLIVATLRETDLILRFRLDGALAALRIPPPGTPGFADRLWEHTCFEAFVGGEGTAAYHELNFSPSGEWAHYVFSAYRERATAAQPRSTPLASWRRDATSLSLDVRIALASLGQTADATLRLGLSAVVEDRDGRRSYWAIEHFADAPDFHDARAFAVHLEPVRTARRIPRRAPSGARSHRMIPEPRMELGLDRLLSDASLRRPLAGRRIALLAHPASVTPDLTHALDALASTGDLRLTAAFGPQHGLRGDKQDNMIESPDFEDPVHGIPVFSLYGTVRRPTPEMMDTFDVLLVDLQDVGTRIYTFLTTLRYVLEESAATRKTVWVLDRPNPIGRPIEGLRLRAGWESFVGSGPFPMRHGATLGELARWFVARGRIDVELEVVTMRGWEPERGPGFGWPLGERSWVNPSPNAANLWMARAYPGTVLLEGTTLSEGRGTTRPLEVLGAPGLEPRALAARMAALAPDWLEGCRLRECWFEPTFHKHVGQLCAGLQVHVEDHSYRHERFRPWRLIVLALKALRALGYEGLWREFVYEYEHERLPVDVINGGTELREWVDDPEASPGDLDVLVRPDEESWREERESVRLYR